MKEVLAIMGVATMLALSLVLFITFVTAYNSPAKAVRVNINSYGEADAEMILLSAILPLNIISTFIITSRLTERKERKTAGAENGRERVRNNYF